MLLYRRQAQRATPSAVVYDNISHRYTHQEKSVIQQRVDQEIDVIQQMDFVPYFLINWDIVQHA